MTRAHVRLLGPCFKTGRIGGRLSHRDDVLVTVRRDEPAPPKTSRKRPPSTTPTRRASRSIGETSTRRNATEDHPIGRAGHRRRSEGPLPSRSEHDGGALGAYRRQMHRSSPPARNGASEDRAAPSGDGNRMNAAEFRQLYPFPSKRFHALLNSLFKVLCNFPSRYLFAIGLVAVFSLR
jgi:hypothetical protein